MRTLDPQVIKLVRRLDRIEGHVRTLQATPKLRNSSLDGGSLLVRHPGTGEPLVVIGEQEDGSITVQDVGGPPPPATSTPLISQIPGGITITWDGENADGDLLPWDSALGYISVRMADVPDLPVEQTTEIGRLYASPAAQYGGAITVSQPADVTTYVSLVSVRRSGVEGPQSVEVSATGGEYVAPVDLDPLNDALDALQASLTTLQGNLTDLQTELDGAEADVAANSAALATLTGTTLPALQADLDAAEASVTTLQGKFPITGPDIAANAIDTNKLAALAVTAAKIAANTITAAQIAADTITANEIAADAITASEIAANAITTAELAANAVTAAKIAAHTITANEIAADTITGNEIAADTITANEIAAQTITANEIAADTITANEIAAQTITANEIATGAITSTKIAAGTLEAGFVLTGKLQVGTGTWTPGEGLIIPGVIVLPAGPNTQTLTINGTPTGGYITVTGNSATSPRIAYNAAAASGVTQTVNTNGSPTGGSFTLSANGLTTSAIAYNASTATVQTAVRTLGGAWATATVSGSAGAWVITPSAATAPLTIVSSLTGGTAPTTTLTVPNVQVAVQSLGGAYSTAVVTGGPGPGTPWVITTAQGVVPLSVAYGGLTGGTSPTATLASAQINASLTAQITATSLTIQKDLNLLGNTNQIKGTLTLSNGVTRPTVAPTVYQSWQNVGTHDMSFGAIEYGLTNHLTNTNVLLTATSFFGGGIVGYYKDTGITYGYRFASNDTGNWDGSYRAWCVNFNPVGGITTMGSNYYVMGYDSARSNDWYIYKLDSSFNKVAEVKASNTPFVGRPAIGNNGTNIFHAYADGANTVRIGLWNPTTMAFVDSNDLPTYTGVGYANISAILWGSFDFGATRIVTAIEGNTNFVCTTGADRLGDVYSFPRANGGTTRGLWWDGTRFWSLNTDGSIVKHGSNIQNQSVTVSYTWYDGNATGGTHETEETTTPTTFSQSARTFLNIETPEAPDSGVTDGAQTDKANRIGIYLGGGAGGRVRQTQVGVSGYLDIDASGRSIRTCQIDAATTGSASPPSSNGFAGATNSPGIIKTFGATSGQGFILNGDGSGQWGQMTVSAAGDVNFPGSGWLRPGDAGGPTWGTSWTQFDTTQYRVVAMKKVGTRVRVVGTAKRTAGSATTMFTLPSGSRPGRALLVPCRMHTTVGTLFVGTDGQVVIDNNSSSYANTGAVAFEFEFDTAELTS